MPYVFWKKCPKTAPSNDTTGSAKSPKSTSAQTAQNAPAAPIAPTAPTSEERITHESMTLDQYYYVSLTDTTDRDRDQVLWRSTDPDLKPKSETCEEGNPTDKSGTDDEHRKILIVNQLWLWIIDESMTFHILGWYFYLFPDVWLILRSARNHHHEHDASSRRGGNQLSSASVERSQNSRNK